jgi:hypothetical protein
MRDKAHDREVRVIRLYGFPCKLCMAHRTVGETGLCMACWLKSRDQWRRFFVGSKYERAPGPAAQATNPFETPGPAAPHERRAARRRPNLSCSVG